MTEIIIGLWVLAGLFFLVLGFMPRMTDEERETMASEQRAKDQVLWFMLMTRTDWSGKMRKPLMYSGSSSFMRNRTSSASSRSTRLRLPRSWRSSS